MLDKVWPIASDVHFIHICMKSKKGEDAYFRYVSGLIPNNFLENSSESPIIEFLLMEQLTIIMDLDIFNNKY